MSEMLGNQYFLARRFEKALPQFENEMTKHPENEFVKKKLVICYAQTGAVNRALDIFLSLIERNIAIITKTDLILEDCPCPELVVNWEQSLKENVDISEKYLILGMFWLYCDSENSLNYFLKAQKLAPSNEKINKVISILENNSF